MEEKYLKQILDEVTSMKSDMRSMQSYIQSMNDRLDSLSEYLASTIDDIGMVRTDDVELKSMKQQQDENTYDISLLTKEVFQHKIEINRLKEQIKN